MKLTIVKKPSKPIYRFDPMEQGLSQSQIQTRLECEEKARLSTVLGWTPRGSSKPLMWGSIFHAMLEAGYKGLRAKTGWPRTDALLKAADKEMTNEYPNPITSVKDTIEECFLESSQLIEPYRDRWLSEDDRVKWLMVEDAFKENFVAGIPPMKGKFDAVFEHPKFGIGLLETKTKSMVSHNLTDLLPLDLQLAYYLTALRKRGLKPTTVWYNIIRRPGLKRGKEENAKDFQVRICADVKTRPDHYFIRYPVTLEKGELDFALNRVAYQLDAYLEWYESLLEAGTKMRCLGFNSGACENKYGTCAFLPICSKGDYSGHYIREHVSPELKELK